jgi:PhzF family phenazine biosynthesis protein
MASTSRPFAQVDVFTTRAGFGNPVAVVLDAGGLSDQEMQRFAAWTNLSETTFVQPPRAAGADYWLRIFTPRHELPFAGHPTLGTARALLDAGMLPDRPAWVQECGAGLIEVQQTGDIFSFSAPVPELTPAPIPAAQVGAMMGGPPPRDALLVDVGPRWLTGRLNLDELDALVPDQAVFLSALDPDRLDGINLYAVDGAQQVHVRSFFSYAGMVIEDPVCGSGNAAVCVHLMHTGHASDVPPVYQARQGRHRGRDGRITVSRGETIWVGGPAVCVVTGSVTI